MSLDLHWINSAERPVLISQNGGKANSGNARMAPDWLSGRWENGWPRQVKGIIIVPGQVYRSAWLGLVLL